MTQLDFYFSMSDTPNGHHVLPAVANSQWRLQKDPGRDIATDLFKSSISFG